MNAPMVYSWKPGAIKPPVAAQIAGERLEEIRRQHNGRMTPADVVNDARSQSSPLHPAFEWNDAAAAESWRREQASYMIRHIAVEIHKDEASEPTIVRAFVSVTEDKAQHYASTVDALSDPELRAQILRRAWGELQAWRKKYDEMTEFAGVFAAMDSSASQLKMAG
jgi:hypothetical protein